MSDDNRLAILKRLMKKHDWNCPAVAGMVGRKAQTVRAWRSGRYPVPEYVIKILTMLLEQ